MKNEPTTKCACTNILTGIQNAKKYEIEFRILFNAEEMWKMNQILNARAPTYWLVHKNAKKYEMWSSEYDLKPNI